MSTNRGFRLLVMRHAKTKQMASSDRVRELTPRGERDARAAGEWLAGSGLEPDVVLVSSATRAKQTAEHVAVGLGSIPQTIVLDDLYGADVDGTLDLLSEAPSDAATVLVIGHNPTMAELAFAVDAAPDEDWPAHLPTAGIVVAEFSDRGSVGARAARIALKHVPRG